MSVRVLSAMSENAPAHTATDSSMTLAAANPATARERSRNALSSRPADANAAGSQGTAG